MTRPDHHTRPTVPLLSRVFRLLALAGGILPVVAGCPPDVAESLIGPTDTACLDEWSIAHFGSGALLGQHLENGGFGKSMALLVGWEVIEPIVWSAEAPVNQQCDLVAGGAGWATAHAFDL